MADQGAQPHRFEVRSTSDSHFAWLRTRLALERTLMSWVRTSVALILSSKEFEPIAGIEVVKVTPLYVISIAITFIGLFTFGAVLLRAL